ncbi:glycoside hydrolase [Allosaccharopolyspora coralli]|uniref:Glycoside hydrolase n=1 Tax=Allosaccharopolyspora coralli TaxID=2665642 RepID=A0A5Q3Q9P1_9PSEU|nr:C40 family peptidase [Allosaccharopolyspora coralli]QGK68309.1 glycoside hydrolase [Allosaccharopolyspora coralli]
MASHRLKLPFRGALAATTVAAVTVGLGATPAGAAPDQPGNASEAAKQLREVGRQAEAVTEEYKKAEDDHAQRQADLERARADTAQAVQVADEARAEEERFRGQVDELTGAAYQGAKMNELSALMVSESPNEFLDRASALDALGKDNKDAVEALSSATHEAESAEKRAGDARARATEAEAESARIQDEIGGKKAAMDAQVAEVKETYNSLSQQEQESLSSSSSVGALAGSGKAIQAVNAALSKQGSPYVFGAKGPSQFDCSGLVQYAYEQAGVELPGSTKSQISEGEQVSQSEMKPGDVIFFYSSGSHNGIYIGGGKMVHAPTEGQTVTVEEVKYMGEVNSVRRFAG